MSGSAQERFNAAMGRLLGPEFPSDIALAVSGGGDSMAMLTLAHNWTHVYGVRLWVVTVDHGLRPESAAEAAMVAEECAALGWPHATLRWHWDGQGNLMDAARRGRLEMIDRWRGGIGHVLMAHTQDDVAETFLMRLKRGSGVDGLSSMAARRHVVPHPQGHPGLAAGDVRQTQKPPLPTRRVAGVPAFSMGFDVIRPCLDHSREELRHVLRTYKGRWIEDPTNENTDYERSRTRSLLGALADYGLAGATLADTAQRLSDAREALNRRAAEALTELQLSDPYPAALAGHVILRRDGFGTLDRETQRRILTAAVQFQSGAVYVPRAASVETLRDRIVSGGGGTLAGVEVDTGPETIRLFREYNAVREDAVPVGQTWDNRWCLGGTTARNGTIRALGQDGWDRIPDRETLPIRHRHALSLPSLWHGATLTACPALGFGPPVTLENRPFGRPFNSLARFLLSH